MPTIILSDKDRNTVYHLLARQAMRAIDNEQWGRLADLFEKAPGGRMEVRYDYDVNGYTVQVLNDDGCVEDEYSATNNPLDSQGPILQPDRAVPTSKLRQWAIESALDFMESYDVDGDPVRDTSIRGGQDAATVD